MSGKKDKGVYWTYENHIEKSIEYDLGQALYEMYYCELAKVERYDLRDIARGLSIPAEKVMALINKYLSYPHKKNKRMLRSVSL